MLMPVNVVLDYPQRQRGRRLLQRSINTVIGSLLTVIGLVATIVLFPAALLVLGTILGAPTEELPGSKAEILLVATIASALAYIGLKVGARLLRGNRELVLFLRRFGYSDATRVATFAAAKTIGRSWRLVTLDDAAVAPLGLPTATRRLLQMFNSSTEPVRAKHSRIWSRLTLFAVQAPWIILAIAAIKSAVLHRAGSFDPYVETFDALTRGHIPIDAIGTSLLGLFALSLIILLFTLLCLAVCLVIGLLNFVLLGPLSALQSAADAAKSAERSKRGHVTSAQEIDSVAYSLAAKSRKIFAPRLVVLRVASPVWQQTVTRLASVSSLIIIDVSAATENLLWEIHGLTKEFGPRCVFVGQHDRVTELVAYSEAASSLKPFDEQLLALLDERDVLVYMIDRRGMTRFARALRAKLLELTDKA